MQSQRIILNTFGSFGDIHPYMAIGLELKARGHTPVIATMEFYREKISQVGLEFAPVRPNIPGPREQDSEFINRIMDPRKGPKFLMDDVIFAAVRESYEDLLQAVEGADLLITHPAAPAGPLVGYKTGMCWISTVLAPFSFISSYDPPVPPFWQWGVKFRMLGPTVMRWLLNLMKSGYKAEKLVAFREELAIPDYGNPIFEGQHSPTLVLALFSELFGPTQPDWPKQTRTTGFCFYDGGEEQPLTAELQAFFDSGSPPIVFTLGSSAVWVAEDFFKESSAAARKLKRRAVLVVGDERTQLPELREDTFAVDYAPYQALFSRACAVVHHGGVGTTAQGLRAGVPTLIVPFAFDQSDNANRARRLGTSRTVYRRNYNASSATRELGRLLAGDSAEEARKVSERINQESGARHAADLIEETLSKNQKGIEEPAYAFGD